MISNFSVDFISISQKKICKINVLTKRVLKFTGDTLEVQTIKLIIILH